jgi:flagellar biosynthetic protein FliO
MGWSTLALFFRLIFSLGIVIGLMWVAATALRRRGLAPAGRRPGQVQVELLARRPLGRNASIAVVRVGGRSMVVGVTDHNVTKLDDAQIEEVDLDDAGAMWTVPAGTPSPGTAWKAMLEQLRNRTVRR